MADVVHGPGESAPLLFGAGNLRDEPGSVWRERLGLDQASRDLIEKSPIMCIEDGTLKVNLEAVSAHEGGSAVRILLEKFKESLVKKNIPVASGVKAAPAENCKIEKVGCISVRQADIDSTVDKRNFKLSTKRLLEPEPYNTPHGSSQSTDANDSQSSSPRSKYARRVEVVRVPDGVCPGDRLAVFDSNAMPSTFIDIPVDACPDERLDFERPATPVKFLLLDGNSYKVGGNFMKQHAVRLTTHRGLCKRARCSVMGCHGDKSSMLFKRLGQGKEAADYHRHWLSSSRESLRSRGLHFRMLASRV
jgi:hypothetical protein